MKHNRLTWFLPAILLIILVQTSVFASCSVDNNRSFIVNEINTKDLWLELYANPLNIQSPVTNWTATVCTDAGCETQNFNYNINTDGFFIILSGYTNQWHKKSLDILIQDNAGNNIDYFNLAYTKSGGVKITTQEATASTCGLDIACNYFTHDNNGERDFARVPDGACTLSDLGWNSPGVTQDATNDANNATLFVAADYRMDECYWDGTSGEVIDSSSPAYNGTSKGDANTTVNAGGGVCYNGNFLSNYVELPTFPDITGSRTITAWFHTTNVTSSAHQRIFADDEVNTNGHYALSVGDPGSGRVRFYIRGLNPVSLDTTVAVAGNTWYFAAATFNSTTKEKTLSVYNASGTLVQRVSATVTGSAGTPTGTASLGGEVAGGEVANRFIGYLDEVKIFYGALSQTSIETILNNEIAGKNYDGTDRVCGCIIGTTPKDGNYNAVDLVGAGCNAQTHWTNTLKTKIVNDTINLSILAKDSATDLPLEANITKVTLVHYPSGDNSACGGVSTSSVNVCTNCGLTDAAGCLSTTISTAFNDHASKCVEVLIEGKDKVDTAGTSLSESNASDNFAIRPNYFNLALSASPYYAGESFNLTAYAKDFIGGNTHQYDELHSSGSFVIEGTETRLDCVTTDENLTTGTANFTNGSTASISTIFSGLAEYLRLSIHEVVGSEFSRVDSDDTLEVQRLITPYELNISLLPYELNVTQTDINASTGMNWLYMADVNDMNISVSASVQANNKQHMALEDFNASCYAKDVNVSFHMNTDGDALLDINYSSIQGTFSDGTSIKNGLLQDLNQSMTIFAADFDMGLGRASMAFNVDRNFSRPINPFYVNGVLCEITTNTVALVENNNSVDENITLYYGRLRANDIATTLSPVFNPIFFEVYDNLGTTYTQAMNQNSLSWYVNRLHTGDSPGNITEAISSKNTLIANTLSGFTFSYAGISSGLQRLGITSTVPKATIHLKTQKWLWYTPSAFGSAYDDTVGSDCTIHPCFEYTYSSVGSGLMIKSGDNNGTLIPDQNRSNYQRKGVKLFR